MEFGRPPDGPGAVARQDGVMTDPESLFVIISTDLALRRAHTLERTALVREPERAEAPAPTETCCASGDYGDAA